MYTDLSMSIMLRLHLQPNTTHLSQKTRIIKHWCIIVLASKTKKQLLDAPKTVI